MSLVEDTLDLKLIGSILTTSVKKGFKNVLGQFLSISMWLLEEDFKVDCAYYWQNSVSDMERIQINMFKV